MTNQPPFNQGDVVRLKPNPARVGTCTGKTRGAGSFTLMEVEFGPNNREYIRASQLEVVPQKEDMFELFAKGRFGGPEDLIRMVVTEKLSGELTNVFYSMGVGNTEFLPHQFKPVLQFIESPRGRLLIADEVGLGKTIEAIYFWKELQTRERLRRLLIVCPSMLREKWKRDLETRFGEEAEIVDAAQLLERLESAAQKRTSRSFILITSLEGIRSRPTDWNIHASNGKAKLGGFLEEMAEQSDPLLDLVIIDEAHYLRNASTASHQTASILRDNSANLVLLSATPIQTSDENLYNLLRLLSPEEFRNYETFAQLLQSNAALIELQNIKRYPLSKYDPKVLVQKVQRGRTLLGDDLADRLISALQHGSFTPEEQIDFARRINERTYFSHYVNRTRKRDVLENRVIRNAHTYNFEYTDYEKYLYREVTDYIWGRAKGKSTLSQFTLIARQRQMTSCLPAAFKHWHDHASLDEQFWEDLGITDTGDGSEVYSTESLADPIPINIDFKQLEQLDSKYAELKNQLKNLLKNNSAEKIIIFSFYRGTIAYLERRLQTDGFRVVSIMGGMGEEKYKIIDYFASPEGSNILISSEVGAEGIDLQFCHILINYDLPWNPMRLEQRIGRIDRIGQKSDKIFIYNMACKDTIEDRVLLRLYERINIFKYSIGDLEDILGDTVEQLALDLINPELTESEREQRLEQNIITIENKRRLRNELEDKAIDLFSVGDYIIRGISEAKDLDRFIQPSDTMQLVLNFFSGQYPGTKIQAYKNLPALYIYLSPEAKNALSLFNEKKHPVVPTQLDRSESDILCVFDVKTQIEQKNLKVEYIEPIHPLIQWIVHENRETSAIHPCSAIILREPVPQIKTCIFVYFIQLWKAEGWKNKKELRFFAAPIDGGPLASSDAERLLLAAFQRGAKWNSWEESISLEKMNSQLDRLVQYAYEQHTLFDTNYLSDNEQLCKKQEEYAERTAHRKISELEALIQRLETEGKLRVIPMHRGRIEKVNEQLKMQIEKINYHRIKAYTSPADKGVGIIKVEV